MSILMSEDIEFQYEWCSQCSDTEVLFLLCSPLEYRQGMGFRVENPLVETDEIVIVKQHVEILEGLGKEPAGITYR